MKFIKLPLLLLQLLAIHLDVCELESLVGGNSLVHKLKVVTQKTDVESLLGS